MILFILMSLLVKKVNLKINFLNFSFKQKQKKQIKLGYQKPMAQKQLVVQKREKRASKPGKQKTVEQLLGELYADKLYLENLLEDDRKLYSNKDRSLNNSKLLSFNY